MNNWSDERDNTLVAEKRLKEIEKLKKEVKKYEKGFNILNEYFDSISEDEQKKVSKRLEKLGL